jgi:hypothetical protein
LRDLAVVWVLVLELLLGGMAVSALLALAVGHG